MSAWEKGNCVNSLGLVNCFRKIAEMKRLAIWYERERGYVGHG